MGLIKASQTGELLPRAVVLDLGDLSRQGEQIIAAARRQAEAIVLEARAERERLLAGAREAGRVEGLAEGLAQGHREGVEQGRAAALEERRAELARLESAWADELAWLRGRREALLEAARRDVLRLACRMSERITKRRVETDPRVAAAQLDAVLALVMRPTRLQIRLHPEDRGVVSEALPELVRKHGAAFEHAGAEHVELVDDPSVGRGGVVVRLATAGDGLAGGELDASIATQIDRIVEAVMATAGADGQSAGESR